MRPETAFQLVQLLPLPIWFVWILLPRSRAARYLAGAEWPWGVLAFAYVACFAAAIATGGELGPDSFTSLSGVMRLFDAPWGALTGWVHYLCFDTFVARWMVNQTPDAGYKLSPVLFATMMFGPIGLLTFFAARRWLR
jgi:ABA4-like protein